MGLNDGAAVRVSLVCFAPPESAKAKNFCTLDGLPVTEIHADLTTGVGLNLFSSQNAERKFKRQLPGDRQKIGAFDIEGELARQWLKLPNLSNGRPNCEVIKPSWNGLDVACPRDGWIIDFGSAMDEADAALYEAPFEYVLQNVKPERVLNPRPVRAKYWW